MACWLCNLPVKKRSPCWEDVAAALMTCQVYDVLGHLAVIVHDGSYMMSLRTALQTHTNAADRLEILKKLEVRADSAAFCIFSLAGVCQPTSFLVSVPRDNHHMTFESLQVRGRHTQVHFAKSRPT